MTPGIRLVLQLENKTPFVPGMFVFPDPDGVDTLYVALKATFTVGKGGPPRVAEAQRPLVLADAYVGEPGQSSLAAATEAHLLKPATDVVVLGAAHAPGGKPAERFGVSLSVGRLKKVLQVSGDRVWEKRFLGTAPSDPTPVRSVPLVWERAFGGQERLDDGKLAAEERNPVGRGFVKKRSARELVGAPLPNFEDPSKLLRSAGDLVPPAGLGPVAPSWQPRRGFAGTYDKAWQRRRAPYLPEDFDPRFFQVAPPDQIYPGFLKGGEPVELVNLSPAGALKFTLPVCTVEAEVVMGATTERPPLRLETLLLEPDQGRFSLLWRGALPCDKQVLKVQKVVFHVNSLAGVAA